MLRELDIEFEPTNHCTRQFLHSLQLSWKLVATCTRHRQSEADIARERKLLQLRVIYLCDRYKISQDPIWTWTRQLCAWFQQASVGGPKKPNQPMSSSCAFVTVTLAANMRGGMRTQIVYEEKSDRVHPHGTHFPRQLVPHSPTHWITQDALLDMIDAIDADMHARPSDAELTPWLLVLDCAPQHVAAEFRSIMRDTRPHIKLCYVQRNFTGYTQPLDRAYMRAFKNSIPSEVAKHSPSSSWKSSPTSNVSNLDSSTSVLLRQQLLSFVHTAAQNADSPPASPSRACMSASLSFVVASLSIHSACVIVVSILHVFRQFHHLHLECGQMTNATAINAVPVLEDVCAGTTRSGACGSI